MSPKVVGESFQFLIDEFEELLYRRDVMPTEPEDEFNRERQKAVQVVYTDDVSPDWRISRVIKRGFSAESAFSARRSHSASVPSTTRVIQRLSPPKRNTFMSQTTENPDIVLGIDLGTTYCAMAVVDRFGKSTVVVNSEGQATTASVIHFYDRDACVVGEEAVKMVVADPTNVVRFIKRSMGEPDFSLEFFGRSYTPQELSAIILKKLKEDAEEVLGRSVRDAVITVPAYFNAAQRGATAEAGSIAGLNVLSIINEPTTAAISYGIERLGGNRRVLVFDLGGGTFDVTLMEIKGISFRTIASDGNAELGGKDWDDRLLNYVAEQLPSDSGMTLATTPSRTRSLQRCRGQDRAVYKAKGHHSRELRGHRMVVEVTREEFDNMCADLVDQCADTCELVLEKARMGWAHLDEVLLVGGSTRMPMIRNMLNRLSGQKVDPGKVNPDECVALGAALAGVLRHVRITPHSIAPSGPRPTGPRKPTAPQSHRVFGRSVECHRPTGIRYFRSCPTSPVGSASPPEPFGHPAPSAAGAPQSAEQQVHRLPDDDQPAGYLGLPPVRITDATSHPLGIIVLNRTTSASIPDSGGHAGTMQKSVASRMPTTT